MLLLVFLAMAGLEVPALWRQQKWGEVVAFTVIWVLALAVSVIQLYHLPVPRPTTYFERFSVPVTTWIEKLL
ncbi:MAG: hypothetical protein PWP65_1756 [Clostridia bacterium]|nr:hypothetical protein [Clostridia bacterium]